MLNYVVRETMGHRCYVLFCRLVPVDNIQRMDCIIAERYCVARISLSVTVVKSNYFNLS